MATLREFHKLAQSIKQNSKGQVLLSALRKGFDASKVAQKSVGAATLQQKAIIFTESRRTQEYLYGILEQTEFKGKIVLFNGSNNDLKSGEIYRHWLERNKGTDKVSGSPTADKRAALVEYFRDEAVIMIATEAAAEGINLQFCNLVVNYDLPWNPQRVEQRIGRCHRYGQKFDVIVVNFLNKQNAADVRVYQLLSEKFKLFNGVFGASDDVLGAVESGVDFEKRIANIYQRCRTEEQINFDFDQLQGDLEQEVTNAKSEAREQLLNNFDQEVIEKVRIDSENYLDRFEERLWALTQHTLDGYALFDDSARSFMLKKNPFPEEVIYPGPYRMSKNVDDANTYRVGHPLAQRLIDGCKQESLPAKHVVFDYSKSGKKITTIKPLVGKSGWLKCIQDTINSFETEDHILLAGVTSDGVMLDLEQCHRLFDLSGKVAGEKVLSYDISGKLESQIHNEQMKIVETLATRNMEWYDLEINKLDKWAEDKRAGLKASLKELDDHMQVFKKQIRQTGNLPEKLKLQREVQNLEKKRDEEWRQYDEAAKEIGKEKDKLMDMIETLLVQKIDSQVLMTISFEVV